VVNNDGYLLRVKDLLGVHLAERIDGDARCSILADHEVEIGNDNVSRFGVAAGVAREYFFGDSFAHDLLTDKIFFR